jgi:hypothetical protein
MVRANFGPVIRAIGLSALLFSLQPANAAESKIVRWHLVGVISGQAYPFTTAAYFPRPLAAGALVDVILTMNTTATSPGSSSYADYEGAITSAKVSGSDWSITMRAPLRPGSVTVANDNPDYGDMLDLTATTQSVPGTTWYSVQFDLRNPGGPNPGVGPWAPFTSAALPKAPPSLGFFPTSIFYFEARRDQPGQALDGGIYYGQILSMTAVKDDD